MKRVLIISYYWPPTGGSGVQRWVKFVKYLPGAGWLPVVYTPENPEQLVVDHSLEKDLPKEAIILKQHIWEPYSLYSKLRGNKKSKNTPVEAISGAGKGSWKDRLALWIRSNLFIPDPRSLWIKPSVRFLKKYLNDNPVDVIISTGPPHSMHLIAKKVAKSMDIPWVADFRDPWTEVFYFKYLKMSKRSRNKHLKLEQSVFDQADRILVVSESMKTDTLKRLSDDRRSKISVIPNGFDEDDFSTKVSQREPFFTLTHTGLFAKEGDPDKLWKALGILSIMEPLFKEKLRIRIIGKIDPEVLESIRSAGLEDNCINMGYMDHSDVILWQQKASVLLLPLRKEPEAKAIISGKFFEYLASGRPIMAFGPVDGDLGDMIRETSSGTILDFEDEPAIRETIMTLWKEYCERGDLANTNSGAIDKYSRRSLTKSLVEILNSLPDNKKS